MRINEASRDKSVVIDNYDSFTYNLVQYLGELGCDPLVFRNDEIELSELEEMEPSSLVISPGPGTPEDSRYFGISHSILTDLSPSIPTLGVCLGHQGVAAAYGGKIVTAPTLRHGKTSKIRHHGKGIFTGLPNPFRAARYHSLIVDPDSLPDQLEVTARTPAGDIMGIRHSEYPIYGVQFHPESILTENGKDVLNNFLNLSTRR
ncbi:MAG: aminodeoxychorismate/anthranilate synthase component II [Candidatus Bipolaricaulota bacterium]|nr:aminodeoxychorismate/anthranilate synthase component II [Candidatus Bipolaricaulota bacterium]